MGSDLAKAVDGCVLTNSLLFQVIQMQLRAPPDERMNPNMYPSLLKETSFLQTTPYTHQMQVNIDLHNYQLARERGQPPKKYDIQVRREECVAKLQTSRRKPQTQAAADGPSSSVDGGANDKNVIVDGNAAAMRSWRPCYSCAVCSPVASGKTAIALNMILCRAMSTAFVTNKPKNADQVLNFFLKHTNIAFYIPVRLLSMKLPGSSHVQCQMTPPGMNKYKFMRHFFNGSEAGIVILDRNLFMPPDIDSTEKRKDCIYQVNYSDYDLLIIDEATDNSTPKFIRSIEGAMLVQGHEDGLVSCDFAIKCKYTMMVMLCGVFYRPEDNGGEFLRKFPIINEPLNGNYMIQQGWIANPRYVVVLCRDDSEPNEYIRVYSEPNEYIREVSKKAFELAAPITEIGNSLRKLTTGRMMVIDAILRFHTTMNHKILVFCERLKIVQILHKLYGNSQIIDGDTIAADRDIIYNNFENPESGMNILFTTSIGGIGLDIPRIQVTVNIAPQNAPAQERQRSGRSERRCAEVSKPGQPKAAWNYSISHESDVVFEEDGVAVKTLPDRMSLITVDGLEDKIEVVREEELVRRLDTAMHTAIGTVCTFDAFQGTLPQSIMPPKLMGGADKRSIFLLGMVIEMSKSKLGRNRKETKEDPTTKRPGKAKSANTAIDVGCAQTRATASLRNAWKGLGRKRGKAKKEAEQKKKSKTFSNADLPSSSRSSQVNDGALVMYDDSIERVDDDVKQMIHQLAAVAGIPKHASTSEFSKMVSTRLIDFANAFNRATCDNVLLAQRLVKANATANPDLPWEARAEDFYF